MLRAPPVVQCRFGRNSEERAANCLMPEPQPGVKPKVGMVGFDRSACGRINHDDLIAPGDHRVPPGDMHPPPPGNDLEMLFAGRALKSHHFWMSRRSEESRQDTVEITRGFP